MNSLEQLREDIRKPNQTYDEKMGNRLKLLNLSDKEKEYVLNNTDNT